MIFLKTFFSIFFLTAICLSGEAGQLKKIRKALEKEDFEKAEKRIIKALEKDSMHPGVDYFLSVLLVTDQYGEYDIDSSWFWINKAISDLKVADVKKLKELQKADLQEEDFANQRALVGRLAFYQAYNRMNLPDFLHYLEHYKETEHYERATAIRDSLAFDLAKDENTWQVYEHYFTTYPDARFVPEARERYQTLIFKDYTQDDRLESYIQFLEDHPNTPFRKPAEEIIFKRTVLKHRTSDYMGFLKRYPETHLRKQIGDILYYKVTSSNLGGLEEVLNVHTDPDSLHRLYMLEQEVLFPIFEGGVYGFLSLENRTVLKPQFQQIAKDLLCGNISSEWLLADQQIINRAGDTVLTDVEAFTELGDGITLVYNQGTWLYHKSGYRISDLVVSDAKTLGSGLIAFQSDQRLWGILTITGHQVLPARYYSIGQQGDFIILEQEHQLYDVTSLSQLKDEALQTQGFSFDDYEVIGDTLFQGFQGDRECLLNTELEYLIPLGNHSIYLTRSSAYVKDESGYQLYDKRNAELKDQKFRHLDANDGWIALQAGDKWLMISNKTTRSVAIRELDSVRLLSSNAALIRQGDTLQVVFQSGSRVLPGQEDAIQFLSNQDESYLLLSSKGSSRLYDDTGTLLFASKHEDLALLGDSTFRYRKNGKMGVLNQKGEVLVDARYDLADGNNGLVFLLNDGKIGCYDINKKILIPAEYQARIGSFHGHYKVQRNGKTGLVNERNELTVPMEYDELRQWNDTSLWARDTHGWKLITYDHSMVLEEVRSLNLVNARETFATILTDEGYGLLSNVQGEFLAPEYNDILNVGSEERPLFFAEQHLKAAAFIVVTYTNADGVRIRSQAYRPEEYEKIYCDQ